MASSVESVTAAIKDMDKMNKMNKMDEMDKIIEDEITRRFNKAKWHTLLELYEKIAKKGMIFGGAPRDYITRVTAAKEYYTYCEANGINADRNYNNQEIHKETFKDRNLFPSDIDVFISEDKLAEFISRASRFHVCIKKHACSGHNYFFESNPLFKEALRLEKWEVSLINFSNISSKLIMLGKSINMSQTVIKIDFVVIKNEYLQHNEYKYGILYPPFGNPDFDINQLMFFWDDEGTLLIKPMHYIKRYFDITSRGNLVVRPLEKQRKINMLLESIVSNIRAKRALPIYPDVSEFMESKGRNHEFGIDSHRISKIKRKGYKFDPFETLFPREIEKFWAPNASSDDSAVAAAAESESSETSESGAVESVQKDEEICLICQDVFTKERRWFKCCSTCTGKMHQSCFSQYYINEYKKGTVYINCPQCRSANGTCRCRTLTFLNKLERANINDNKIMNDELYYEECTACNKSINLALNQHCKCWSVPCRVCIRPNPEEMIEQTD